MKRLLTIAIAGLLLCAGTWWLLHGGAKKVAHRYADTDFAKTRSLARNVQFIAAQLEEGQREPPKGKVQDLHIDFNDWGHPIQYGWEDGTAVVRAAGKDGKLHTGDDITSIVHLKKKEKGATNDNVVTPGR